MDPLRSAKRTVTCLRSPSRALFDVRIFSARCFGVYESGDWNLDGDAADSESRCPQLPQNFRPGGIAALPLDHLNSVMAGCSGASASGVMDYLNQHGITLLADY